MTASQDVQDSFNDSLNLNSPNHHSPCGMKRQVGTIDNAPPPSKRICAQYVADSPSKSGELPKFTGFLTAGLNHEIKVSEAALNLARARLCASSDRVGEDEVSAARSNHEDRSLTGFAGFVTAGTNKLITVSDSALELARRRLNDVSEERSCGFDTSSVADTENRDPTCLPVASSSTDYIRASSSAFRGTRQASKQTQFVSPLLRKTPRTTRTTPGPSAAPVTRSSKSRLNSSFRVAGSATQSSPSAGIPTMPSRPPATLLSDKKSVLSTVTVDVHNLKAFRITCVRDLRSCPANSVDFLGIVVGTSTNGMERVCVPTIKMADRYGESVQVELQSSSIPANILAGSVISIEGAAISRNRDSVSLIVNDSAFVDLEPNDPEAECLHRLFQTGLFEIVPSEGDFTFDGTALRVIGRLSEYSGEVSTVMARICNIQYDALVYLGCITCKRYAVRGPDGTEPCQNCNSKKARYFYSLHAEIADFSALLAVHFSDEAAEKLIGKPAGAMVKLQMDVLRTKLSPLYYRPMLFRISQQSSRWFIDEWKHLEISRFKPFLRKIAEQKGYK